LIISGILLVMLGPTRVFAATVDNLDPSKTYQISRISISGNSAFSDGELLAEMRTKQQPPYIFWKKPPPVRSRHLLDRSETPAQILPGTWILLGGRKLRFTG
jgi:hypothetical protein